MKKTVFVEEYKQPLTEWTYLNEMSIICVSSGGEGEGGDNDDPLD